MDYLPTVANNTLNKSSTFIYVISNNNHAIKIGHSYDPFKRLRQLQTGNDSKLKLLLIVEADKHLERRLHKMFFFHKRCGEWFNVTPELLDVIINYLVERYPTKILN